MATNFVLTLDTTAPAGVAASINSGDAATTSRDVSVACTTSDGDTTGYQVKIWGDVDAAQDANIQPTEGASAWISLATPHSVRLSTGDGTKTISIKMRDDVHNATSSAATDSITLDTTAPVPNVTAGPTPDTISEQATKDESDFTFSTDVDITSWKVKVVPDSSSLHTAGTQIPTTAGSTNMTGGALAAATPQNCMIKGTDLETAGVEDANIIKLFVQEASGLWSI